MVPPHGVEPRTYWLQTIRSQNFFLYLLDITIMFSEYEYLGVSIYKTCYSVNTKQLKAIYKQTVYLYPSTTNVPKSTRRRRKTLKTRQKHTVCNYLAIRLTLWRTGIVRLCEDTFVKIQHVTVNLEKTCFSSS